MLLSHHILSQVQVLLLLGYLVVHHSRLVDLSTKPYTAPLIGQSEALSRVIESFRLVMILRRRRG
jgi:hypothetical protein